MTASQPRIGSFCTGYGGLDMAVQQVFGGDMAWVADNDPGAAAILAHHWPDVPNLGDITAADWAKVPTVDIIATGFPCQDLSYAGRGEGIQEGNRSGLWLTIARAVGALRPRLVVLENVRAIVGRRPGLDVVLADLARLGFDAEWTCRRASDVGAPHERWRWFLLAWPSDAGGPRLEGAGLRGATPERRVGAAADTDDQRGHRSRARGAGRDEPAAHDLADADAAGICEREPADETISVAVGGDARPVPGGGDGEPAVDWGVYGSAIARWEAVTGRRAPRPTSPSGPRGAEQLSPRFVEWMQGLDAGHVTDVPGLTRNQQLHALGNGVVPLQGAAALHDLREQAAPLLLEGISA